MATISGQPIFWKELENQIRAAITKATFKAAEDIIEDAKRRLELAIREDLAAIALQVFKIASFERLGTELVIKVDTKDLILKRD